MIPVTPAPAATQAKPLVESRVRTNIAHTVALAVPRHWPGAKRACSVETWYNGTPPFLDFSTNVFTNSNITGELGLSRCLALFLALDLDLDLDPDPVFVPGSDPVPVLDQHHTGLSACQFQDLYLPVRFRLLWASPFLPSLQCIFA